MWDMVSGSVVEDCVALSAGWEVDKDQHAAERMESVAFVDLQPLGRPLLLRWLFALLALLLLWQYGPLVDVGSLQTLEGSCGADSLLDSGCAGLQYKAVFP